MSALISLLGGSAFRLLFGEVFHFFTAKREHAEEIERMRLQAEIDAAEHARNLEALKLQSDLGIKTIQVQSEADAARFDASAWAQAVADVGKPTGIKFIDIWNGAIRPALATMATIMVITQFVQHGFVMTDWDMELVGGILGIYIADRQLAKRGK